jgi:hypothetical protein
MIGVYASTPHCIEREQIYLIDIDRFEITLAIDYIGGVPIDLFSIK